MWDTEHKGFNEFDMSASWGSSPSWFSDFFSDTTSASNSGNSWSSGDISGWWDDIWSPKPKPNPTPKPAPIVNPVKPTPKPAPIVNPIKPNPLKPDPIKPIPIPAPTGKPIAAYSSSATEVNWVKKNATTHLKDQGTCGSCWAYAANGVMESFYLIQGKGLLDLSEQQLVDCQKKLWGCEGGLIDVAFDWVITNGLVH